MIICKDNTTSKIKYWGDSSIHVVTDFDRTLTIGESESSWGILSTGDFVSPEYIEDRNRLYKKYRPIEIDETMDWEKKNKYMIEWWNKHISLFIKYKLKEEVIKNAIKDVKIMRFRDGAIEMLKSFYKRNIPVIIISAGIGNFIELFLKLHGCYFDNIFIMANFIKFEEGIAVGIEDMVIHSLNKNEVSLPDKILDKLKNRNNIILMGDNSSDINMISEEKRKKALKIGFLEENVLENKSLYEKIYDVVCMDKTNFKELNKVIPLLMKDVSNESININ